MRRALTTAVAVGLAVLALVALAEATQNRPDPPDTAGTSRLTLDVRAKGIEPGAAARSLLAACRGTVLSTLSEPQIGAGGHFAVEARPALGRHAGRRLAGCLQDATLDRISARLLSIDDLP